MFFFIFLSIIFPFYFFLCLLLLLLIHLHYHHVMLFATITTVVSQMAQLELNRANFTKVRYFINDTMHIEILVPVIVGR